MKLTRLLSRGWRRLLDALRSDDRQRLIEFLRKEYLNEARDVVQFREHAKRMTYPQFGAQLLRIAEEEYAHVEWLRAKIRSIGGEVPDASLAIKQGRNPWENLRIDAEEEQRDTRSMPNYRDVSVPSPPGQAAWRSPTIRRPADV